MVQESHSVHPPDAEASLQPQTSTLNSDFIPSHPQHIQEVLVGYRSLKRCNHHCSSHKVKGEEISWVTGKHAGHSAHRASEEQQATKSADTTLGHADETTCRHQPCRPNSGYMGSLLGRFKSAWLHKRLERSGHCLCQTSPLLGNRI